MESLHMFTTAPCWIRLVPTRELVAADFDHQILNDPTSVR